MRNYAQTSSWWNLGTRIESTHVMYAEISDYIRTHPERQEVSELGDPESGWLSPVDDRTRDHLALPETATALIEWNRDAEDGGAELEIRALDHGEQKTTADQATSTLIDRVLEHYDRHPNDGHPAYGLWAEYQRRRNEARGTNVGSSTGRPS